MLPFLLFGLVLTLGWVALAFLLQWSPRKVAMVGAALFLGLALMGCRGESPTAPDITIVNQNTNTQNSPNPTGSPSSTPGAGDTLPAGSSIRVGFFGISCQSGTPPRNGQGILPIGCQADATCTPKGPTGIDLDISVTGPEASWQIDVGAANVDMVLADGNPYNRKFTPRAVGVVRALCKVKNLTGSFEFSVTN